MRRVRPGAIEAGEIDEGMFYLGLLAAAQRLPFLPTRAGLGSDVLRVNPDIRTVRSPYAGPFGEHEELVAVPAMQSRRGLRAHEPGGPARQRPVPRA